MDTKSKAFKGLIFVLVAAIVVVGALLVVRNFVSPAQEPESNLPEGMSIEDLEGADSREFTIDENGNVSGLDEGAENE